MACGDNRAYPLDGGGAPQPAGVDAAAPFTPTSRTLAEVLGLAYTPPRGTSAAEEALRRTDLALAAGAGLGTLRVDFRWAEIEPARGTFDFAGYDRVVDEAHAAGLEIVAVLGDGAPWTTASSGGRAGLPPDDARDFGGFVGATAAHFAGRVRRYEVWSEQNAGWGAFAAPEDPERYAELLTAAAAAARAADREVVILLGGLRYHGQTTTGALDFLAALYAARPDIGASFDVVALHPYATWPPTAAPEDDLRPEVPVTEMVARVRELLARHADPKPVVVTEYGWPVYAGVDEVTQARFLVRGLLQLAVAGSDLVLWRTLRDGPAYAAFPPDDAFGLLRYDADPNDDVRAEPKVSWQALLNLLWLVGHERLVADLRTDFGLDPWTYAYRLGRPGYWVTVMWRGLDDDAQGVIVRVPVRTSLRDTVLVTLVGAQLPIISVAGSWEIIVGPEPLYLIERVE